MKKILFAITMLVSVTVLFFAFGTIASAATYGNMTYTIEDGEITITDCNSSATTIEIPAEIGGLPVTTLDMYAFSDCKNMNSVKIPSSVTFINDRVFPFALKNVYVESLEQWLSYRFDQYSVIHFDNLYFNNELVTELIIPDTVTDIPDYTFYGCDSITKITLPDLVVEIGLNAFNGTGYYKNEENWEDGVLYCGKHVLDAKENITECVIKEGTLTIADFAFSGCEKLKSVVVADSVKCIGHAAFSWCYSLESVRIGKSVEIFDDQAFFDCRGIQKVYWDTDYVKTPASKMFSHSMQHSARIEFVFGDSVKEIPDDFFSVLSGTSDKNKLTSVTLGKSIKRIGVNAFYGCTELTKASIPDSVDTIGGGAFRNCMNLESITIPDNVTIIEDYTFSGCTGLKFLKLGRFVESFGESAFEYCIGLTIIEIPDTVVSIGWKSFNNCTGLTEINIPDSVEFIDNSAFRNCIGLTSIIIPDTVERIGWYAFENCIGLRSITIPDSVTSIGDYAFNNCINLTDVYVSDVENWMRIQFGTHFSNPMCYADNVYFNGERITTLIIPENITVVGDYTFDGCAQLLCVVVHDDVSNIGHKAFNACVNISAVYYEGSEQQWYCIEKSSYNDDLLNCENFTFDSTDYEPVTTVPPTPYVESPYAEVIKQYAKVVELFTSGDEFCEDDFFDIAGEYVNDNLLVDGCQSAYYDLIDINGDGVKELIISATQYGYDEIVGVFTHDGEKPVSLFDVSAFSARSRISIYYGGIMFWSGSGGAGLQVYECYVLPKWSTTPERIASLTHDTGNYFINNKDGNHVVQFSSDALRTEIDKYCVYEYCFHGVEIAMGQEYYEPEYEHEEIVIPSKKPTCTEPGFTEGKKCSICGKILVAQETIPATGHDYKTEVIAPTCTEKGYTIYSCDCGFSDRRDYVVASGHTPGEWEVVTAAQAGIEGKEQLKCTVCDSVIDHRSIPALPTFIPGDVNGDGKITAADARIVLRISAKLDSMENYNLPLEAFDVTGDGKLNAADARKILRISAKLE